MPETKERTNSFIHFTDAFAHSINAKANELYNQLIKLDVRLLEMDALYKDYFQKHHLGPRLFFSLQNSAHIIYHSVKKTGRPVNELTFIDYGAGLGTLFMLAGKMGFKKTVYNDYLPEWHGPAKALCTSLKVKIDFYVPGDVDAVMQHAAANNILYDIIASRNVIEHIYSLPHFYQSIFKHNSKAVTFSTTTANYHNPAMRWYHVYIHNKWERLTYSQQREEEIKKMYPSVTDAQLNELTKITRGKGQKDFTDAVHDFMAGKWVKVDDKLRSNSCNCITGVWNEHLLTKKEYENIVVTAGFHLQYTPGYWDTHYKWPVLNMATAILNKFILMLGNRGVILSPFVNVVAYN